MLKKLIPLGLTLIATLSAENEVPVVILGSGIAALTAAVQTTQAGTTPLVITGASPGGIIIQSHSVQNWPGEIEITGADLADKLQQQAKARGVLFKEAEVIDIDTSKRPFLITTKNLLTQEVETIQAQTCIVALGASPKLLNVPGESENLFHKIFTCAPCDGLRFKDKTVAIIGGGDAALLEASYLSNIAKKVYIVVRKDRLKTTHRPTQPNVELLYNAPITAFSCQNDQLVLHLPTEELVVDGAFLAIGSTPNTALFQGKLALDESGYIILKNDQETSVPGIYAAGDVSDRKFRQATTAAGDATKAALQAQESLNPPTTELSSLEEMRQFIGAGKKYSVVYFYGTTCSPCRLFRSTYEKWALQFGEKATFAKVNTKTAQECCLAYHIYGIPTIIVFDSKGKIVRTATGLDEMSKIPALFDEKF